MLTAQGFEINQKLPTVNVGSTQGGWTLGNPSIQLISERTIISQAPRGVLPTAKLEALKRQHFTPEGRIERIARSLAALDQAETLRLTPTEWRIIAEDPDLEDQD